MVLLFDEADAVAKARDDRNVVGELRRVVNSLLQSLDYFAPKESIVILASNHSHTFDPAVWRRFDDIIEFPRPGQKEREAQLRFLTGGMRIEGDLSSAWPETPDFGNGMGCWVGWRGGRDCFFRAATLKSLKFSGDADTAPVGLGGRG